MVSIHMPSEDELAIIKIKENYNNQLMKVITSEEEQKKLIKELAKRMQKTVKEKNSLLEIGNDLQKSLDIAVMNPSSIIKRSEITTLEKSRDKLSKSLINQRELADSFMDLSSAMNEFIKKKEEYQKLLDKILQAQRKWQKNAYKYLKDANKFVSEEKLRPLELTIQDLGRDINRQQNIVDKRIQELMEESKSMDKAWDDLKTKIKNYGW